MADSRTTELLPCPICGGVDTLKIDKPNIRNAAHDNYLVLCDWLNGGCGASGGTRRTEAEAIAAWNTRAPVEYDGWFYLPKPKEGFVRYGDPSIVESGDGYMKARATVDVIESAARAWEDQLGDYVMERICEVFNPVETCILEGSYSQEGWLDEREPIWTFDFSCGHSFTSLDNEPPAHCPDCGRKVVTP